MLLRPVFVGGMVCSVTHKDLKQENKMVCSVTHEDLKQENKMVCSVTHEDLKQENKNEKNEKKEKEKKILLNTGQENNITQPKTNKSFSFSSHFPSFFTV